jgi:hypothetical protein
MTNNGNNVNNTDTVFKNSCEPGINAIIVGIIKPTLKT